MAAAYKGHGAVVKALLDAGADTNLRSEVSRVVVPSILSNRMLIIVFVEWKNTSSTCKK